MTTALTTTRENGTIEGRVSNRPWASAPVDVYESDDAYLVFADVPGAKREDIDILFSNGDLRIHASRASEGDGWVTDFKRSFTIGSDVDVDKISAELSNGVLQVNLPKLDSAKPRQIAIKTA